LGKATAIIEGISEWTGKLVSFLIIPIIFVIMYEVVLRGIFNKPQIWPHETSGYLFGALFMLGGAYTLIHRQHVNVDILVSRLGRRTRAIIDSLTSLVILAYIIIVVWRSGGLTVEAIKYGFEYPSVWAPPLWPLRASVTLGAVLVLLQTLANLVSHLQTAVRRREQ